MRHAWLAIVVVMACGKDPASSHAGSGSTTPTPSAPAPAVPEPTPTPPPQTVLPTAAVAAKLPEVAGNGYAPATANALAIVVRSKGIFVGDAMVARIDHGEIEPTSRAGGGVDVPDLGKAAKQLLDKHPTPDPTFQLVLDESTRYRVLLSVMYSIQKATSARRFTIVARDAGGRILAVPLALPARVRASKLGPDSGPSPLRMIVSVTNKHILVWSISQREGTIEQPVKTLPVRDRLSIVAVGTTLRDIVRRHWPTPGAREAEDRQIILQADPAIPLAVIAPLIGAVRAGPDGSELFPDVLLSSGFL